MGFKKISGNKNPKIDEMRRKMKEKQSTVHTNPLLETPVEETPAKTKKNTKVGRKSVKKYTQHYSTYFTKEQEENLLSWCENQGIAPSMAIRMAVVQMLGKDL